MARMRRSSEQTLEYRIEQAEGEDLTSYLECAPAFVWGIYFQKFTVHSGLKLKMGFTLTKVRTAS